MSEQETTIDPFVGPEPNTIDVWARRFREMLGHMIEQAEHSLQSERDYVRKQVDEPFPSERLGDLACPAAYVRELRAVADGLDAAIVDGEHAVIEWREHLRRYCRQEIRGIVDSVAGDWSITRDRVARAQMLRAVRGCDQAATSTTVAAIVDARYPLLRGFVEQKEQVALDLREQAKRARIEEKKEGLLDLAQKAADRLEQARGVLADEQESAADMFAREVGEPVVPW